MPFTVYAPLLAYLRDASADRVSLSFAEIEALIDRPLSVSAQVSPSFWTSTTAMPFARTMQAMGWQAHLDMKAHAVTFHRAGG
jgi:hypothetical protein